MQCLCGHASWVLPSASSSPQASTSTGSPSGMASSAQVGSVAAGKFCGCFLMLHFQVRKYYSSIARCMYNRISEHAVAIGQALQVTSMLAALNSLFHELPCRQEFITLLQPIDQGQPRLTRPNPGGVLPNVCTKVFNTGPITVIRGS